MSENNQNSTNSSKTVKPRLGRGLGSLLGGVPNQGADFANEAPMVKATIISRPGDPKPAPAVTSTTSSAGSAAPVIAPSAPLIAEKTVAKFVESSVAAPVAKAAEKPAATVAAVDNSTVEVVPAAAFPPSSAKNVDEVKTEAASAAPVVVSTAASTVPDNARIWTVPVEKLVANSQQPRQVFEDAALKELAASIKEKGILQPITAQRINEREFQIIAGERRWRAAQMAGLKEVPVILRTVSDQDSLELAILENIQRADLNPIEEAEAYDHLMKTYQLTQAQVADRLGKERPSIANALRLMALPPEVKLMIGGGELSSGHAKVLLGLESMADQISLAKEVIREKLSVRALEKKVAEKKSQGTGATAGPRPAMGLDVSSKLVEALAGELQKLIGTRVVIDYADRRGKLSVYFHSDEQLTEVVERMRRGWAKSNATQNTPIGSSRA